MKDSLRNIQSEDVDDVLPTAAEVSRVDFFQQLKHLESVTQALQSD